jgi:hypothetical protein
MASPLQLKKKIRWPSEKKAGAIGDRVSDFIPYVSNVANMFSKVPKPIAPKLIDPVINQKISLDNAKQDVNEQSRAADLTTQGLDAHTGAAIRIGNLATRLRALSDINSREASANAQITNQTNAINANINAQNTGAMNAYQDDTVNAQMAQRRQNSENISNAADKYISQQMVKEQGQLERDKMNILSKMFNPGVYNRLLNAVDKSGVDVTGLGMEHIDPFKKLAGSAPNKVAAPIANTPVTTQNVGPIKEDVSDQNYLPSFMRKPSRPKYMMQKFAAGGMLEALDTGDPVVPKVGGTQIAGFNPNNMVFSDPITRNARLADLVNYSVAGGHSYNSLEGNKVVSQLKHYFNPQFANDFTARLTQLQAEPGYGSMTPEKRLERYYSISGGNSEFDNFTKNTRTLGGSPSAFYQNSPTRAAGGKMKRRYGTGGKMYKPFC